MTMSSVFSVGHIALTAAVTAGISLLALRWRVPHLSGAETVLVALVAGAAVCAWRLSANVPPLNEDGVPGFSANDWLAPVLVYVILGLYAAVRPPRDPARWAQVRALLTVIALVVDVVTI